MLYLFSKYSEIFLLIFIFYWVFFPFFNFIVVQVQLSAFSPIPSLPLLPPPPSILTPLALSMGPSYMFLDNLSPSFLCYPPPPPLWFPSVCSVFQCLWFYFACLFVLLIKFHLKVKSDGICLLLPELFHLA